jgi:ubiquinone/menaquinone biosynthesis C-methylase UbiE/uncharacterized protein YbaR (Trm112 family)
MIPYQILSLMRCPSCLHPELGLSPARLPALQCTACDAQYPIVDGIADMVPQATSRMPGAYRTETFSNVIAPFYDMIAPVMSVAFWRCSPLRYVDSENHALGRANGGVYLKAPIGTGIVLDQVLADYHDLTIVGMDRSWKMLRQAQRRFERSPVPVTLLRVDFERLPFLDGTVDSTQSLNGLHTFQDRVNTLLEMSRCLKPGGYLSGTSLIRGQETLADLALARYERAGVFPMLRSAEFLLQDLRHAGVQDLSFETQGAVMFFAGNTPVTPVARAPELLRVRMGAVLGDE